MLLSSFATPAVTLLPEEQQIWCAGKSGGLQFFPVVLSWRCVWDVSFHFSFQTIIKISNIKGTFSFFSFKINIAEGVLTDHWINVSLSVISFTRNHFCKTPQFVSSRWRLWAHLHFLLVEKEKLNQICERPHLKQCQFKLAISNKI